MNDPSQKPTIEEVFPFLDFMRGAPLEHCKAAYEKFDESSPGYQMDRLHEWAAQLGSTKEIIAELFPGMEPRKRKHLHDFSLAIEYAVRLHAETI